MTPLEDYILFFTKKAEKKNDLNMSRGIRVINSVVMQYRSHFTD